MLNLYPEGDLDKFQGFKMQRGRDEKAKCFSAVPEWYSTDVSRREDSNDDDGMDTNQIRLFCLQLASFTQKYNASGIAAKNMHECILFDYKMLEFNMHDTKQKMDLVAVE